MYQVKRTCVNANRGILSSTRVTLSVLLWASACQQCRVAEMGDVCVSSDIGRAATRRQSPGYVSLPCMAVLAASSR